MEALGGGRIHIDAHAQTTPPCEHCTTGMPSRGHMAVPRCAPTCRIHTHTFFYVKNSHISIKIISIFFKSRKSSILKKLQRKKCKFFNPSHPLLLSSQWTVWRISLLTFPSTCKQLFAYMCIHFLTHKGIYALQTPLFSSLRHGPFPRSACTDRPICVLFHDMGAPYFIPL